MGLGQVNTVEVPTRWSCASSKTSWQTGRCVLARCLCEEPMSRLPHFRSSSSSSHPFTKVCQNLLVVDLVNGLTFRHPIHVNNPSDVEKNYHNCFKFGFALPCFLLPWWTGALPVHGLALTLWVVLKKNMIHHKLLRSLKSLCRFQCFEACQHKCSFEFPFVQERGVSAPPSNTLFFMLKLLCKQNLSNSLLVNAN